MYVYFIKSHCDPACVKVGKATNVKVRLSALQVSSPFKLELLGSVLCWTDEAALSFEARCHRELEPHRSSGEWFTLTPEVEARVATLMETTFPKPIPRKLYGQKKPPAIEKPKVEEGTLSIPIAAERYSIDAKRLRGYIWRNGLSDPIGDLAADRVYVDWRLERLAQARAA